ncbi:MAG: ATP-binding protein [Oscillatoriales cyanobacterium RM2_1_1]|nr:ATP-binding protein [Oscillatoriales cyanobacterium RM2_1_1]
MTEYYESLTVPADLNSLSVIAEYVKQVGTWAKLSEKKIAKLRLAVDEVATNIIDYGYSDCSENSKHLAGENIQSQPILNLHAKLEKSQLILWIEDTGILYDPTQNASPKNLEKPLEERELGGLGIYLAHVNVDDFIYEQVVDHAVDHIIVSPAANLLAASPLTVRNRNTFVMNLP